MWCKGCLAALLVCLVALLVTGYVTARNLGSFLDVSEDPAGQIGEADAIVVMGGEGARYMRTRHALELYEEGVAPVVVFSGGTLVGAGLDCSSTEMSVDAAAQLGLPSDAVVLAEEAQSTWDEGENLARLAEEYGWQSLMLVTDRFHTRRSLRTLQNAMPGRQIYASAPADERFDTPHWWDNEYSLLLVVNEVIKLGFYWKEYGILPFG